MKTLLTNMHVLTMDAAYTTFNPGFISITNDKITAVGPMDNLPTDDYERVIDGKGALAIPGMINTHTHIGMVPFRSLGDDTPDRLTRFFIPFRTKLYDRIPGVSQWKIRHC